MTIGGALSDLNNLLNADDIPCYYKPSIKAVIDTIALEQESCDDVVALDFSADIDEPNKYQTKDGKWHEGRIPMQQPCEDCISRAEALKAIEKEKHDWGNAGVEAIDGCLEAVGNLPSVTPQQKSTGSWVEKQVVDNEEVEIEQWQSARCSKCDKYHTTPYAYFFYDYNYCPICGAKMEVEDENKTK